MICKICKRRNHKTENCFHNLRRNKNRFKIQNKKPSFQNKALKITEPTGSDSKSLPLKPSLDQESKTEKFKSGFKSPPNSKLGLKPLHGENSKLGLKPLDGENPNLGPKTLNGDCSLNYKSKTQNLDSKSKFENLIFPETNSGRKESRKTLEPGCLEFPNSRILELENRVKKLKKEVKSLRQENLILNILYFSSQNSNFFEKNNIC